MWQVKIHPLVIKDDFKGIPPNEQKIIIRTLHKKLSLDPQAYGEPLRGEFLNYWRLRIGDYRAVYRIDKDKIIVLVIKVGIRKDDRVYNELFSRLKKI